ncbi:hypothetical protein JRQ81_010417 [Phrynocephalus forsythii]|uniref:DUF4795 domain-containing protein n=1 Tax=Phrynocephalus forsythii TaxID=171643 RepID=A0A9Q0X8K0_9SAUR|nr:hypothetical protein JRQ81_010417 [Phrynocephalus forsythii]
MSRTISFVELVNLAIGTPELGNVNFNALHLFLHSLLDHLHLQDVGREVTDDELDFIKPPAALPASVAASAEAVPVARKSSSIFHQMHERISALERQLSFLNDTPDTGQLLARSQGAAQPAQDMWQMMQLKKKMEVNEEGMAKAMRTLQDLLSNINSLTVASSTFEEELGQLKDSISKINMDEMKERLLRLDEQARLVEDLREQLGSVKPGSAPALQDASDLVHWSTLCAILTGKSFPEEEKAGREKASQEVLSILGQLPERHEALMAQVAQLEAQLKQQAEQEAPPGLSAELKSLLEQMDRMQSQEKQRKESLQGVANQVQQLKEQCEKLQRGMERLSKSTADIQTLRLMLEQLDITKADKALIQEEMNVVSETPPPSPGRPGGRAGGGWEDTGQPGVGPPSSNPGVRRAAPALGCWRDAGGSGSRCWSLSWRERQERERMREEGDSPGLVPCYPLQKADKSALETKVNHGELQVATTQLSEMMQDLLQKMSLQDKDWQKALEKLFTDMDCKLDRMALDPLSRQLEEVWKFVKKYLSEGPRFDADSAAGFKKQLFERVKCISCDRPVTMMTGPHMITVRKVPLRPRPASANGYEYLQRPQRKDQETTDVSSQPPPQTCWQCQAQTQACTLKRLSRSQELSTVYPYGDPAALTYDNTEVDILGVNGVLYKGRVSSQAGERVLALQKELAVMKPPRPPSRMERARSAFADVSASLSASSSLRRPPGTGGGGGSSSNNIGTPRQQQPPPAPPPLLALESMDEAVTSLTTSLSRSHLRNGGGVAGL